ncbi:hypothetical protein CARUB_v10019157mg [Capsella rubella]|uniref:Phosphoglycerate mutase family protein n=1 Tax=Capsella rubella TaxID=81985 RepID=R0HKN9_9BRAS|nr:hypothetical protein CARUB_v10019157mg [Capsella rubella]
MRPGRKQQETEQMETKSNVDGHQHVIMMRHGDRIDKFEPQWVSTAARPWMGMRRGRKPTHRLDFCACVELRRQGAGDFEAITSHGQDGIMYPPSNSGQIWQCLPMITTDRIKPELAMPQWEETVERCTDRFLNLIKTLADKYPSENLLLVTHDVDVYDVEYCACAELRRQVLSKDGATIAGDFEVITSLGQCGIKYHS